MNPKSACGLASITMSLICVLGFVIGALYGLPSKLLYSIAAVLMVLAFFFIMLGCAYDDITRRPHRNDMRLRRRGIA